MRPNAEKLPRSFEAGEQFCCCLVRVAGGLLVLVRVGRRRGLLLPRKSHTRALMDTCVGTSSVKTSSTALAIRQQADNPDPITIGYSGLQFGKVNCYGDFLYRTYITE